MKLLVSFLISIFIYISLIIFFWYFVLYEDKNEKVSKVYIHQAIIAKQKHIVNKQKQKPVINNKKQIKKTKQKKIEHKSKDTFSKAGKDISFDDIFSTTSDNIPTKKIKLKKKDNFTKNKGEEKLSEIVKKRLSFLNSVVDISETSDKKSGDYIANEFGKIWSETNTEDGNFVTLQIDVINNKLNVIVIATNLDTILLNSFLTKLNSVDISKIKNFHAKITFNTKLKGN